MSVIDQLRQRQQPGKPGHCRIFPTCFNSLAEIPQAWRDEFWSAPSPWCRVEGQPDHPEFEANLVAAENFYVPD